LETNYYVTTGGLNMSIGKIIARQKLKQEGAKAKPAPKPAAKPAAKAKAKPAVKKTKKSE